MNEKNFGDILVVDDTPENLRLLMQLLKEDGYKVRPASSGRLAIKVAEQQPPDLILLDITMPEMNGFETCERIKQDERLKDIPVIFISALTDTVDKVKAFNFGGVDYVTKPFQAEEVLARVSVHLSLRRARLELEQVLEQLRLAQANLIQSEKMASLGLLTAGIAHEINNPVGFIGMSATGLAKALTTLLGIDAQYCSITTENVDQKLRLIKKQKTEIDYDDLIIGIRTMLDNIDIGVKRTSEIVNGLRDFSQPERGGEQLTDIGQCVDTALIMLKNRFGTDIQVNKSFEKIPRIPAYPMKLGQVFLNLINNAIDASKENEAIRHASVNIRTRSDGDWACIEISDSGAGVPEAVRDHIFEPFFTTKEVGKGSGLGLSISHGILDSHGGRIEVSDAPAGGALFQVWLPIKT